MESAIVGGIIGVVGTLFGTVVSWILNEISNNSYKADIYFLCNIDNLPPSLVVYCRGNKPIILRNIEITINHGELLVKKEFFTENVELGNCDVVSVLPGCCKKIPFTLDELIYGEGHYTNISCGKREQHLRVRLTDIRGKVYKTKSKCTLQDYEHVIKCLDGQS